MSGSRGCPAELVSQHFCSAKSRGVVEDGETLVFAVLDVSHVGPNGRLTPKAFPSDRLSREEASLARLAFTTKDEFMREVVQPAVGSGKLYQGVATVIAGKVRELDFPITENIKAASLCVIDKVESSDFDGHAVVTYSRHVTELSENQNRIGRLKQVVRMDLANEFSELKDISDVYPAP